MTCRRRLAGEKSRIEYHEATDAAPFKRALPRRVTLGDGELESTIEYDDLDTVRSRGPRGVTTTTTFDEWRRPVHVLTSGSGGVTPEEWFAYDASGRLT